MINGYEAAMQAMALLGYTPDDSGGQPWERLFSEAPFALGQIYTDLYEVEQGTSPTPPTFYEPLLLSARGAAALPYGMAMILAQTAGDETQYARFFMLYTEQRAKLSRFVTKADVLPITAGT